MPAIAPVAPKGHKGAPTRFDQHRCISCTSLPICRWHNFVWPSNAGCMFYASIYFFMPLANVYPIGYTLVS